MGEAALETARALGDRGLIAAAASALALGEAAAGPDRAGARAPRRGAASRSSAWTTRELAHRLETLYYLGWAENYLEHYDDAIAHAERGVAIARATGEGRLLVPLMLLRALPVRDAGPARRGERRSARPRVEIARLSANPHFLFWALCELAWARYFAGDLDGTIAAGEESVRVGGRMRGGTMPSAGGGAGWALALAALRARRVERARGLMHEVGGEEMENWFPAERCFNWENVALAELALGNGEAADCDRTPRGGRRRRRWTCACRRRWRRARAPRCSSRAATPRARPRAAERSVAAGEAIGARLQVAYSRSLLGRALAAAGDRRARDRGAARGRARARRLRLACGCATRRGASCASSAPAPRRADRRRPTTRASGR